MKICESCWLDLNLELDATSHKCKKENVKTYSEEHMQEAIETLEDVGFSKENIAYALKKAASYCTYSRDNFNEAFVTKQITSYLKNHSRLEEWKEGHNYTGLPNKRLGLAIRILPTYDMSTIMTYLKGMKQCLLKSFYVEEDESMKAFEVKTTHTHTQEDANHNCDYYSVIINFFK